MVANMLQIKVHVRKIYLILVTFQKVQGMNSIIMKIEFSGSYFMVQAFSWLMEKIN